MKQELQDIISKLGNTPLEEPEITDLINNDKRGELLKKLFKENKLKPSEYTGQEQAEFIGKITEKVLGFKDEEGNFKRTPNTENCELPDFFEAEELYKLTTEMRRAIEANDIPAANKIGEKTDALCLKISKLDISILTEWEKLLVTLQINHSSNELIKTSVGKPFGI